MTERDSGEIKLRPVFTDTDRPTCITFVLCREFDNQVMIFAASDCTLSHTGLLEIAVDSELLEMDAEPVGGGHLDYKTLQETAISQHFGKVDRLVLEEFQDKLLELREKRQRKK